MKADYLIEILKKYKGYDVHIVLESDSDKVVKDYIRVDSNRITKELELIVDFKDESIVDTSQLDELKEHIT